MQMILRTLLVTVLVAGFSLPAAAQVTGLNSFSPNTRILSADVNFNFTKLSDEALRRQGGTLTGNITVSPAVTIDGVDLSAWLDQSVQTTATPTFASVILSGGLTAGSGTVGIIDGTGKIPALTGTYLTSVDGTALTGIAKLASTNAFSARNDLRTYTETKATPAIGGGALALDLTTATQFVVAKNGNATVTFTNTPGSGVTSFTLVFTADGTPRTITWPASVKWSGGSAPALTSTNNKQDVLTFITHDGGTTWLGFISGLNF